MGGRQSPPLFVSTGRFILPCRSNRTILRGVLIIAPYCEFARAVAAPPASQKLKLCTILQISALSCSDGSGVPKMRPSSYTSHASEPGA
jgi:hypothetical protein